LPDPNPWRRNIRLGGFDFFPDGRAAFCTFDGDVWIAEGIKEGSQTATWTRFASGLHEPKTVCVVDEKIYVSDRNGIVRLIDSDGNGEADWYENFSNIVPQTAETREFAMDMVADGKGGFFLAKGGQVGSTRGIANGTIVQVAPDGRSYEVIATGLRQPYIGYDPESGILTSSDQQGHWKPATPIYRIERGKYYGFQPAKLKDKAVHPDPIAPPEIWIPHFINQSGASQVWMKNGANMGLLNQQLVHIGYNRPEIFRVYLDENRNQGAVVPILSGFPAGILKGRIHPQDGRLYTTGFEIWGNFG
jgi:glucose/arabinose dehydrogenase